MENGMIIAVIIVALFIAIRSVAKKAKSKSSCCGSGTYVARSKKLKTVTDRVSFQVEGMHCQNCVNRIMENLQSIPGVSASVDLKKGRVTVAMEQPVERENLRAAMEKSGYTVIGEV